MLCGKSSTKIRRGKIRKKSKRQSMRLSKSLKIYSCLYEIILKILILSEVKDFAKPFFFLRKLSHVFSKSDLF